MSVNEHHPILNQIIDLQQLLADRKARKARQLTDEEIIAHSVEKALIGKVKPIDIEDAKAHAIGLFHTQEQLQKCITSGVLYAVMRPHTFIRPARVAEPT